MSRPDRMRLMGSAVVIAGLFVAVMPSSTTYAAWSDLATVPGKVGAGVWLTDGDPPMPMQCIGIEFDRIIIGSNKNDGIFGTAGNDLIFGLQGRDVLRGLGGQDCLVGGNGKDELRGEDGDDVLVGGNAKDAVDGGTDDDVCDGGRGKNVLINCAAATTATSLFSTADAPIVESQSVISLATSESTPPMQSEDVVEPGGGASVEDPPEAPLVDTVDAEPALGPIDDPTAPEGQPVDEAQP